MSRPVDPDLDDRPKVESMDLGQLRRGLVFMSQNFAEEKTENRKLNRQISAALKDAETTLESIFRRESPATKPLYGDLVGLFTQFDNLVAGKNGELDALRFELQQLKAALHVPGVWQCRTCNFVQVKSILAVDAGEILADRQTHMEPCPNEGDVMFPVTWKEYYEMADKACETQVARAVAAELALRKVKLAALTGTNAQAQFGRIIRICIDAGVTEHLPELLALFADGKEGLSDGQSS